MPQLRPRDKIINFLLQNRVAGIPDLSNHLGISRPAVRFHIRELVKSNDIEQIPERRKSAEKGRPTILYRLSSHEQPNNYPQLIDWLFNYLRIINGPEEFNTFLTKLSINLSAGFSKSNQKSSSRMISLIKFFKNTQHDPRWEAHKDGPRVFFSRCPYQSIIDNHPELCVLDKKILEQFLDFQVEQIQKISSESFLTNECIFCIVKTG